MGLIGCPECEKQISEHAVACPNCGYPIANPPNSSVAPASSTNVARNIEPKEEPSEHRVDARGTLGPDGAATLGESRPDAGQAVVYAGATRRVIAYVLDAMILTILACPIAYILLGTAPGSLTGQHQLQLVMNSVSDPESADEEEWAESLAALRTSIEDDFAKLLILPMLLQFLIGAMYFGFYESGGFRGSIGKQILGLSMQRSDAGGTASIQQSLARYLLTFVVPTLALALYAYSVGGVSGFSFSLTTIGRYSLAIASVGLAFVFFTRKKQSAFDLLARTEVHGSQKSRIHSTPLTPFSTAALIGLLVFTWSAIFVYYTNLSPKAHHIVAAQSATVYAFFAFVLVYIVTKFQSRRPSNSDNESTIGSAIGNVVIAPDNEISDSAIGDVVSAPEVASVDSANDTSSTPPQVAPIEFEDSVSKRRRLITSNLQFARATSYLNEEKLGMALGLSRKARLSAILAGLDDGDKQYERIAELITHLCERVGCESDIEKYLSEQPDWRNIPGLSSKSESGAKQFEK